MKLKIGGNGGSLREEHLSHLSHLAVIPSDLYAPHKVSRSREKSARQRRYKYIFIQIHIYMCIYMYCHEHILFLLGL